MSGKRNLIVVALVVVAAGIAFVGLRGQFPPGGGTEGAIGTANRYQAQQIGASDVSLKDARIQAFMQTDLFHKVATNGKFRALVKNPHFRALAANKAFLQAAGDASVAEFLSNSKHLLASADFAELLKSKKLQSVAEQEHMVSLFRSKLFGSLATDPGFVEMLKDPGFDELMENAEAQKAVSVKALEAIETEKSTKLKNLAEMEKKSAFVKLIESNELQEAATQGELADIAELLETTNIEALLSDEAFQEMLNSPKAMQLLAGGDEMASVVQNLEDMAHDDSSGELFSVFADPSVVEAFSQAEMEEIASANLLEEAVSAVEDR